MCCASASIVLMLYGGLLGLTYWQFDHAPTGFIPQQDKGYLLLNVQLPDSASVERTQRIMARIESLARSTPGVEHTVGVSGQSLILNANAPNLGSMYVLLKPFSRATRPPADGRRHRRGAESAVASAKCAAPSSRRSARRRSTAWARPAASSSSSRTAATSAWTNCSESATRSSRAATRRRGLQGLFNSSRANTPWLYLDIDRTKCMALGVPVSDLFNTLQVYLGSYYVNNFNEFGRTWQVNVQADPQFRGDARDIRQLQVRNNQGQMIRLGTLLDVRNTSGPVMVMRYNMYSGHRHHRQRGAGTSSGQAIALMQEIASEELPRSMASDWTELALLQLQAGNTAMGVFLPGGGLRVSGAGGAVRKLEAAAGGHPGGADVSALLARGRAAWPAWK